MSVTNHVSAANAREPLFDHERLKVYQMAVEVDGLIYQALPRRGQRELREQLERASLSVIANIAEGAGRTSPKDKRRFYARANSPWISYRERSAD